MKANEIIALVAYSHQVASADINDRSKRSTKISAARRDVIRAMHVGGFTLREISDVTGMAYGTVTYHMYPERRARLLKFAKERYATGKLNWVRVGKDILQLVALETRISVVDMCGDARFGHFVAARDVAVQRMRAAGLKVYEIAIVLHKDPSTISYYLYPAHRETKRMRHRRWRDRQRATVEASS